MTLHARHVAHVETVPSVLFRSFAGPFSRQIPVSALDFCIRYPADRVSQSLFSLGELEPQARLPVRRRKSLLRVTRLAIDLLPGEDPPSRLGQVTRYGDHRVLMILSTFDPSVRPHDVRTGQRGAG
jgi:hypothetical protein